MTSTKLQQLVESYALLKELGLVKTAASMVEEAARIGKSDEAVLEFTKAVGG
ncbi:hypothetical protein LPJ58_001052, partial [Coemansia sp. RSA 1591]